MWADSMTRDPPRTGKVLELAALSIPSWTRNPSSPWGIYFLFLLSGTCLMATEAKGPAVLHLRTWPTRSAGRNLDVGKRRSRCGYPGGDGRISWFGPDILGMILLAAGMERMVD